MTAIPIIPPLGGVSDSASFENQNPATTTSASNVVSVDPVTNRERIAQREGTELFTPDGLGITRVQHGTYVTYSQRQVIYEDGAGSIEHDDTTPSRKSCPAVVVDSQGSQYWIDGTSAIVKRNADGEEVWQFSVPVKDENHILRALSIDERDHLYVAVSEGGAQSTTRIWCYEKDDEKHLKLFWHPAPIAPGAYVEQMFIHEGKLYTAQNYVEESRSAIVVYEQIDSSLPEESWRKDVPYPASGIGIKPNGEIVVTHPQTTTGRWYDRRYPNETAIMDNPRWSPSMEEDYKRWHWCTLRASDIPKQLGFEQIQDGDEVTEWRDSGPRGLVTMRPDTAKASGGEDFKTPVWKQHSLGGKPAVAFRGNFYRLISEASAGNTPAINDVLATLLPGKGKGFIIMVVLKVSEDTPTAGAAKKGRIWAQSNDSVPGLRALYVNAAAGGGAATANLVSTSLTWRSNVVGSTTDPATVVGKYDNTSGACIVTIVSGNNSTDLDRGAFRVNGVPLAYFNSTAFWTDPGGFSYLGCTDSGTEGPVVDILEIQVYQSALDDNGDENLPTFPDYNVATSANTSDPDTSDTFVERLEGDAAIRYGIAHLLDRGDQSGTTVVWDDSGGASAYGHPFSLNSDSPVSSGAPPNPNGRGGDANGSSWDVTLLGGGQMFSKWSPQRGNIRWAYNRAGTGAGLAILSDGDVVTVGPVVSAATSGNNSQTVRRWNDLGDTAVVQWSANVLDSGGLAVDYAYEHPRLAVDKFDTTWIPFAWPDADVLYSVVGYAATSATTTGEIVLGYAFSLDQQGQAVALPPVYPDYTGNPTAVERPEFLYVATANGDVRSTKTTHKLRIVDVDDADVAERTTRGVAVCGGTIVTFNQSAQAVPTGGTSVLRSGNRALIGSAFGQGKLYLIDGQNAVAFDPQADSVERWKSSDSGTLPSRCKLLIAHADRAVLARNEEDPQNWFMSEKGDFTHWDLLPSAGIVEGMAVAGNSGTIDGVKPAPDIITSLWSFSRELMLIGCDASIHAMVGDPTAGGYIDLVTEEMGMAFGYPYASDGLGVGYFVNNRCEVCAFSGGRIKKISGAIDRRLRDIDLSLHRFELQWDTEYQRLRLFVIPLLNITTPVTCWQWGKRFDAWWPVDWPQTVLQPTCSFILDGDGAADRVVIVGCLDGKLAKFSRTATTDRGYLIESHFTTGPYRGGTSQSRLRNPKVTLAADADGCRLSLFASNTPDVRGDAQVSVELLPGQNERQLIGVRGAYTWLELRGASPGQRWAMESGHVELWESGRKVGAP